jgi:hypothetical protein
MTNSITMKWSFINFLVRLFHFEYNQTSELWGNYGDLVELWFDGGLIPVSQGGPDVAPILKQYQPNAIVFNAEQVIIVGVHN